VIGTWALPYRAMLPSNCTPPSLDAGTREMVNRLQRGFTREFFNNISNQGS